MDAGKVMEIVNGLTADGRQKDLWRRVMGGALGKEAADGLFETLRSLIEELGEEEVGAKILHIAGEHASFPAVDILRAALKVSGEMRRENEHVLMQLRQMLSELATPIIRIWTDILLVAMIGNLDGQRAQNIAERLLNRVSSVRAKVVLVDVTGVPMIDTVVGGFLMEMFNAIKFLGAEVILTGIKPEVAHTLVKLGVDFQMVTVARDLEDALRRGIAITMEERKRRRQLAFSLAGGRLEESGEDDEL
ncbi:STAS domain-containing protein [Desulfofundulus thermosubterraneus]|uniref:RsbT co-antagonist protein RsbR n=1 Tax=Desulfofundulus thermosubterraneus DSM 16057 TaxID=1121432 RepID=A0A1M6EWU7_9FIRM|nr:STAS domain-containing protein [Desulfofundulus thermosubterraneus]SHI89851.1 rsbT co-antagonist protein RsbR [Desulfofundulus thermosubterraneus DSM 16057]